MSVETFTCARCGASLGLTGPGSDDDMAAEDFYDSEVEYHESGECTPAVEAPSEDCYPLTMIMRTPRQQRRHMRRLRTAIVASAVLALLAITAGVIVGRATAATSHSRTGVSVPLCSSLAGAPFPAAARTYGCVEIGPNGVLIGHIVNTYRCRDGSPLILMVNDDDLALTEYALGDEPVRIGTGFGARLAAQACGANS